MDYLREHHRRVRKRQQKPDKRNLGPLLKELKKNDIVIAAEISRLGRDLYMVMGILHFWVKADW